VNENDLKKVNVAQVAAELDEPFAMINVAAVEDLLVSLYRCEGALTWHKHVDIDELFWVQEGAMLLESAWGRVRLRPGEMAVVPKGVDHRSSSTLSATVLLLRCGVAPDRKNGHRRLYTVAGTDQLRRFSLERTIRQVRSPHQFETVVAVEESAVEVGWGEGTWPVEVPAPHDLLFLVTVGAAIVRTPEQTLRLQPGDLTVVPGGTIYQFSTTRGTTAVRVSRERTPGP